MNVLLLLFDSAINVGEKKENEMLKNRPDSLLEAIRMIGMN